MKRTHQQGRILNMLGAAVLVTVLLAADASAQCVTPTPIPTCLAGQVLTSDGTSISCVAGGGTTSIVNSFQNFTTAGTPIVVTVNTLLVATAYGFGNDSHVAIQIDGVNCALDQARNTTFYSATCIQLLSPGSHTIALDPTSSPIGPGKFFLIQ